MYRELPTIDPPGTERPYYVRARRGAQMLGVSLATWWRMVADGRLPAPVRLGRGITLWSWADVEAAIAAHAQSAEPR